MKLIIFYSKKSFKIAREIRCYLDGEKWRSEKYG